MLMFVKVIYHQSEKSRKRQSTGETYQQEDDDTGMHGFILK